MARKKKENVNYNPMGYSAQALKALGEGKYDELTGRDPVLKTSADQLRLSPSVPALKGMKSTTTPKRNARTGLERGVGSVYDFVSGASTRTLLDNAAQNIQTAEELNELVSLINFDNTAHKGDPRYAPEKPKTTNIQPIIPMPETNNQQPTGDLLTDVFGVSNEPQAQNSQATVPSILNIGNGDVILPQAEHTNTAHRGDPRYAVPIAKPATRYTNENVANQVAPASPDLSDEMLKDFEDFWEWRYNKSHIMDYDPESDHEVEHWRNVQKDLMKKYNMTDQEFFDTYSLYDNYRWQMEGYNEVADNIAFAEENPILGSGASLLYAPEAAIEGVDTAIRGVMGEDAYDTVFNSGVFGYRRDFAKTGTQSKEGMRQAVQDQIDSDVGKFLYNASMSIADMGTNIALSGGNSLVAGIVSGAQNAAQNEYHALERGVDPEQAARFGLVTGAISAAMNAKGLDWVFTSAPSGITNVLQSMGVEGLENVVEDITDGFIDQVMNDDKSESAQTVQYYMQQGMTEQEAIQKEFEDFLVQELTSFVSGAAVAGGISGIKNSAQVKAQVGDFLARQRIKSDVVNGIANGDITNSEQLRASTNRVPDSVEMARAQAERANAEITQPNVNSQQTEVPQMPVNTDVAENVGEIPTADVNSQAGKSAPDANYSGDTSYVTPNQYRQIEGKTIVGKATIIPSEYTGNDALPIQSKQNADYYVVSSDVYNRAVENINNAMPSEGTENSGFASKIKQIYKAMFGKRNSYEVPVENLTINSNPYNVTVYKNIVAKALGSQISPEKLSVLEDLDKIISQSNWVGSSDNVKGAQGVSRYDYFEKPITVNGKNFLVTYSVEVRPSENKYRTHAIIDEMKIQQFSDDTGNNVPGAKTTGLTTEDLSSDFNVTPVDENVNTETSQNITAPVSEPQRAEVPEFRTQETPQAEAPTRATQNPTENGELNGRSDVVENTAINSGVITDYEYNNDPELQEIAKYAEHHNEETYKTALENVKKNHDKLLEGYLDGTTIIDNDRDVDQSMILLRELSERLRNGDESVRAQRNLLLHRLREAGTKWGQNVQAFAKWNSTAEGAEINGKRILAGRTKVWEGGHQGDHDANVKIASDLADIINKNASEYDGTKISNGANYKPPVETDASNATSSKLDAALKKQGYDNTMESAPKPPKTHEQHRIEVENSIKKELGSVAKILNDNDYEVITNFVENGVSTDVIADEISHRLNHGTWYTIDESTPVKKQTSSKLARVLKNMGDDSRKASNKVPEMGYGKSRATIEEEVRNTLAGDAASLGLDTPEDVAFISDMLEKNVPDWQIEDEIQHRLLHGEWYELDNTVEPPKKQNAMIRSALDSLVAEENVQTEKPQLTHEELCQQIRNTLDQEPASSGISRLYTDLGEFTDADVDYLAYMIENGATKEEIAHALDTKLACGTFDISLDTENKVNLLFEHASQFDPNSKEACQAKAMAYKLIADEVVGDATAMEKFEAWRYLAMLGNPKTMLRNFVGNTLFNVTTGTSNSLAAILETGTDFGVKGAKWALNKMFKTDFDTSKGIERRRSLLLPTKKDASLVKASLKDADDHMYSQLQGEKYEKGSTQDKIKRSKSVFNSKAIQAYEAGTDIGISDSLAVKTKYSTSLAGYLKANGFDQSIFDLDNEYRALKEKSRSQVLTDSERARLEETKQAYDALEKGRKYALEQAEYATFHEDNELAKLLSKWSMESKNAKTAAGTIPYYLIEGLVPFKKTPANILRSGVEFSPLGILKTAFDTGRLIWENTGKRKTNLGETYTTKSKITGKVKTKERLKVANVLDDLSKTITGTGLMALGFYLRNKGVLNTSSEKEKYQDQLEGIQNYSITIGGKTYTLDWAAPAVMPMIMGAELSKIKEANAQLDKDWYENWDEVANTVNALFEPMVETSMLQGVKNTLESAANEAKYGNGIGGVLGATATNLATNYLSQALPTASGQVARTVDPYRRATDTASDQAVLAGAEKQVRKLMNKIPFLSMLNQKYVDAYGREQMNSPSFGLHTPLGESGVPSMDELSNIEGNADFLYQAFSPSYIADINQTDADRMARDVYNAEITDSKGNKVPQLDEKVFAKWQSKVSVGDHKFTPEEMYQYRTASGQANYAIRDALSKEDWFKKLDPKRQANILKDVNSLVDKIGKEAVGYKQDSDALTAYNDGGNNAVPSVVQYYKDKNIKGSVADKTGMKANSTAVEDIAAEIENGNQAKAEEMTDEATQLKSMNLGKGDQVSIYWGLKGNVPSINSTSDYQKFYRTLDGVDGSSKNNQISQKEFTTYLDKYGNTMTQDEIDTYCRVLAETLDWKRKDGTLRKARKTDKGWKLYFD